MQEYVCADGRMSVNGQCSIQQPLVDSNQDYGKTVKTDFSKDVKSNFQWDFDKVGTKVESFSQTINKSLTDFDNYVTKDLGIGFNKKTAMNVMGTMMCGARAMMLGKGLNQFFNNDGGNNGYNGPTNMNNQGDIMAIDYNMGAPSVKDNFNDTYGTGHEGGIGSSDGGPGSPGSEGPGGSDSMGSF